MKKVLVADLLNKGNSHLNFNQSFLNALILVGYRPLFLGNKCHCENLSGNGYDVHPVSTYQKRWGFKLIALFLKTITKRENTNIFIAADNYLTPTLLVLFFPFFTRKNIVIVLHNNIAPLVQSKIKRIPFKVASKLLTIEFITLSKNGSHAIQNIGFKKSTFIPHMNFENLELPLKHYHIEIDKNKTSILLYGRQAKFFVEKMLHLIKIEHLNNIQFIILYKKEIKKKANILQIKEWVENSELYSLLQIVDFTLFYNEEVLFRPSGILIDSISNNCPIIAPNKGHFSEFNSFNIGHFYKSLYDLQTILDQLNQFRVNRNHFSNAEFQKAASYCSINMFSEKLKPIIH